MTLIVFVVDTSFSMAAKNYRGCSTLDTARSYISEFIKMRSRDNANKLYDRYYVITSEDFPRCIKEIKQLNREGALNEQLKNLRAKGNSSFVETLYNAFQFLTLIRNASGIENYGYGRYPYYIDPVLLVSLSDGKGADDIPANFKLDARIKTELTKEAYRWDQKLYSVVFRMGAECAPWAPGNKAELDVSNAEKIANLVGGHSFKISVHKEINPSIEIVLGGIASPGVYVKFVCLSIQSQNARLNGEAETSESRLKKKLEMRPLTKINVKIVGGKPVVLHWPIPESYWHKRIEAMIPPRNAHPVILFSNEPVAVQMITDFPFDKYELEPSPLVDYIIEKFKGTLDDKQCLPVFIHNSGKVEGYGKPFGFLKPMSTATGVNLIIMPYNYPVLLQLLHDLKEDGNIRNNLEWKKRMENYLDSVPPYYLSNLRKHLQKLRVVLDDQPRQTYNPNIVNYLTTTYNQAKEERDKILSIVTNNQPYWYGTQYSNIEIREMFQTAKHWKSVVDSLSTEKTTKKERRERRDPRNNTAPPPAVEEEVFKNPADVLDVKETTQKTKFHVTFAQTKIKQYIPSIDSTYKNPLILKREELVSQIPRMMANLNLLLRESNFSLLEGGRPGIQLKLHHAEELHQLPIQQMGNYEDYIKAQNETGMAPLRELEPKAMRSHAFGNPFKTDKKSLAVDEVGEGPVENNNTAQKEKRNNQRGKPPRRKAGPLALNSLCAWRERRRSLSECSSMVSDSSYTSDLEMEDLTGFNSGKFANGFSENSNGSTDTEIISAAQSWGLEDETEEPPLEPRSKKRKLEVQKGTPVLDEIALRAKKREVAEIVRRPGHDVAAVEHMRKVVNGLSINDKLELVQLGSRESTRFKRYSLAKELENELMKLQKLAQSQNNGIKPR